MPSTFNGIGTHYWGKKNLSLEVAVCENCGRNDELKSYDTMLWFVVVFFPVLPLGRRRVLNECRHCTRHRVMKLRDYQELKQAEGQRLQEAWQKSPQDANAAQMLIGGLHFFRERERLRDLAPRILAGLKQDPQTAMMLGQSLMALAEPAEAERCFRKAREFQDSPAVREMLIESLLEQLSPEAARKEIWELLQTSGTINETMLHHLVQCYQASGRHRDALDVLQEYQERFPNLASGKEWRRLTKLSRRHEFGRKPVSSGQMGRRLEDVGKLPRSFRPGVFSGVFGLLTLLALGFVGASFIARYFHPVYLVNGLQRPYSVALAGRNYELQPGTPLKVRIPEGDHSLEVLDPFIEGPQQKAHLETAWYDRLLSSDVPVWNPDRTALLLQVDALYEVNPTKDRSKRKLRTGKSWYRFTGIEYVFRDFPEQIDLPSGRSLWKRGLQVLTFDNPKEAVEGLEDLLDEDVAVEFLRQRALAEPEFEASLDAYLEKLQPAQRLEFLKPRLDRRPPLIDWHRAYQHQAQMMPSGPDLQAQYKAYRDAEPQEPAWVYLLGRITVDPETEEALYQQVRDDPRVGPFAKGALAWGRFSSGQCQEALTLADEVLTLLPGRETLAKIHSRCLLALGRGEQSLSELTAQRKKKPHSFELLTEQLQLLGALGHKDEAEREIQKMIDAIREQEAPEAAQLLQAQHLLQSIYLYANGDQEGFAQAAADVPGANFHALVAAGQVQKAAQLIDPEEGGEQTAFGSLELYLAAQATQPKEADGYLVKGLEALRALSPEYARFASQLSGEVPLDGTLLQSDLDPTASRILLTVAGTRFPDVREPYFAQARKLNIDPTPPYHQLRALLGN